MKSHTLIVFHIQRSNVSTILYLHQSIEEKKLMKKF